MKKSLALGFAALAFALFAARFARTQVTRGGVTTIFVPTTGSTAGGDLTGTYPNPTIAASAVNSGKIALNAVDTTKIYTATADSGKVLASCGGVALWRVGGTCP